ncbi:MAG: hypothetical protein J0L67_18530 [Cytophagales bacterium]|nr:hypothetical protein [Cytophagales bacterium]
MKWFLVTIPVLLINFSALSQLKSNYASGFEVGFKEGYCYNNKAVDCFYPMTPEAPLPRINEDKDNYTQGYNRGFQFGLDLKRSNDALSNSDANLNYQLTKFNDYIQQNPIDAMAAVGMMMQKKYDTRKEWIQERINQLAELSQTLFNKETLPSNSDVNSIRNKFWKVTVDYVNGIRAIDYANDYQFGSIQSNLKKIESYYYKSYNENISRSRSYAISTEKKTTEQTSSVELTGGNENKTFSGVLDKYFGKYSCAIQTYELTDNSYTVKETKNGEIIFANRMIMFRSADNEDYKGRKLINETLDSGTKQCIYSTDYGDITVDYDFKKIVFYDLDHKHYYVYIVKNKL